MQSEATGAEYRPSRGVGTMGTEPSTGIGEVGARSSELQETAATRPDLAEFLGAFAVGTLIGAGATLLLRPEPKRGTERIRKDLAPFGRRVRKNTLLARRNFAAGADAASAAAEALGQAGRTLIHDLREEVAEIVGTARIDLSEAVNEQVGQAVKLLRRNSGRKGRR